MQQHFSAHFSLRSDRSNGTAGHRRWGLKRPNTTANRAAKTLSLLGGLAIALALAYLPSLSHAALASPTSWTSPATASSATASPVTALLAPTDARVQKRRAFVADGHLTRHELQQARPSVTVPTLRPWVVQRPLSWSLRPHSTRPHLLRATRPAWLAPARLHPPFLTDPFRTKKGFGLPLHERAASEARHVLTHSRAVRSHALKPVPLRFKPFSMDVTGPALPSDDTSPSFGKALVGSATGTLIGALLGSLLIAGANESGEMGESATGNGSGSRGTLAGAGILLILAGPPIGAVESLDIKQNKAGAYAVSGLGELIVGGAGAALGVAAGQSDTGKAIGALVLGVPGVALGAAGGATVVASNKEESAFGYNARQDEWTWQVPPVHVRTGPRPAVHVSVLRVRL